MAAVVAFDGPAAAAGGCGCSRGRGRGLHGCGRGRRRGGRAVRRRGGLRCGLGVPRRRRDTLQGDMHTCGRCPGNRSRSQHGTGNIR